MRRLHLDDLLQLEQLGGALGASAAWAPDGSTVAVVMQRPKADHPNAKYPRLQGMDRADVLLVDLPGGTVRRLTTGADDHSGWWAPAWSPDGRRLAMLSTRGGGVHCWVWDRDADRIDQVSQRQVRLQFARTPFVWIDTHRLLCPVLPDGVAPVWMTMESRAADRAMAAWPVAWAGQHPTASVLTSSPTLAATEADVVLHLHDLRHTDPTELLPGLARFIVDADLTVAPDHALVAVLTPFARALPPSEMPVQPASPYSSSLRLVPLDGAPAISLPDLTVEPGSLAWAPDGSIVAALVRPMEHPLGALRAVMIDRQGTVTWFLSAGLSIPAEAECPFHWTPDGRLLVRAGVADPMSPTSPSRPSRRHDWWYLGQQGTPRNLTRSLSRPPDALAPGLDADAVLGVADGALWRIPLDRAPTRITTGDSPVTDIVLAPRHDRRDVPRGTAVVVAAGTGDARRLLHVDLTTDAVAGMARLPTGADLLAVAPSGLRALLAAADAQGSRMWDVAIGPDAVPPRPVWEANTFLAAITLVEPQSFTYQSLTGEVLTAWLLLPPNGEPGPGYPTVTVVYPGTVHNASPDWRLRATAEPAANLQLLAASGYAVLLPSMPIGSEPDSPELLAQLPNGVLPAVDEAVRLGIADPNRLYLWGHSFGGYGVYGLLTQTDRFNAAVASAGVSDLISLHGTFDARARYEDHLDTQFFQQWWTEAGQASMGAPPWRDVDRYVRNSPLFAVERVRTPLLIVHNDLDVVGIGQAEAMFGALYRLGRPVEFARYWGESHVLESPANLQDFWQRMLAWFGRHSGASVRE
jgi:dipeptidyl aminopeptidase/acylaminoacyl peptidase